MRAPCPPANDTLAASSLSSLTPSSVPSVSNASHGVRAGEPGAAQRSADLGERPAVAGVGGAFEGGFDPGAAGEQDRDQVEVGGEGVPERLPALRRPARRAAGRGRRTLPAPKPVAPSSDDDR